MACNGISFSNITMSAFGFSLHKSTLYTSPNGGKELYLLQFIKSFALKHKSTPNASDAYIIHPGFPKDISRWIKKTFITITDINSEGVCIINHYLCSNILGLLSIKFTESHSSFQFSSDRGDK